MKYYKTSLYILLSLLLCFFAYAETITFNFTSADYNTYVVTQTELKNTSSKYRLEMNHTIDWVFPAFDDLDNQFSGSFIDSKIDGFVVYMNDTTSDLDDTPGFSLGILNDSQYLYSCEYIDNKQNNLIGSYYVNLDTSGRYNHVFFDFKLNQSYGAYDFSNFTMTRCPNLYNAYVDLYLLNDKTIVFKDWLYSDTINNIPQINANISFNRIILVETMPSSLPRWTLLDLNLISGSSNVSSPPTPPVSSNNALPIANFSLISTCFNESNPKAEDYWDKNVIEFDISAYDTENDNILYGVSSLSKKDVIETVDYEDTVLDFQFPNYDYKANTLSNYPYCNFTYTREPNNEVRVTSYLDKYMLELNGLCSGIDKGFIYKLPYTLYDLEYSTKVYGLTNLESFNFTLWDSLKSTKIVYLNFNVSGTRLNIYDYNSTNFVLIANVSNKENFNFSISMLPTPVLTYENVNYSITKLSTYQINYIEIEPNNNVVFYQEEFSYSGSFTYPDLESSPPLNFTIHEPGFYDFYLYISDDKNTGKYKRYYASTNVPTCEYYIPPISEDENSPIGFVDDIIGPFFRNYYNDMGTINQAKTALWWLFIGLIIFFAIAEFQRANTLSLTGSVLPSALLCFMLSFFLNAIVQMIVFLIFIALSLIGPLRRGVTDG